MKRRYILVRVYNGCKVDPASLDSILQNRCDPATALAICVFKVMGRQTQEDSRDQ